MKKFLIILFSTIILASIGAGAVHFYDIGVLGSKSEKVKTVEDLTKLSIDTDIITTNLASSNFAVVQFNLLLSNDAAKEEMEKRTPEVRAAIISTVASFTKDQLTGEKGIVSLEQELLAKLNNTFDAGKVDRVLVTEFKLQ
ncbi:flagellar basal body-associated FliL family protein [Sporosarcina jiandibaonis]|uniref:flagellar basal body-associated FliL family protein n=1 Tax=Sporosarcina jiandibaonis TaxID=2715535 RepID=UPI001555AD0F|nr:flagellar basal body-associated FliL family protein [Sporosarcina jiandibaonis]